MDKVSMGYAEIGDKDATGSKVVRQILVGRGRITKYVFSHLVKHKRLAYDRIVEKVIRGITDMGNTGMVLNTDGESAPVQVNKR